jgi:hypothetical protein
MFVFAIVHALSGDAIDALVPLDVAGSPGKRTGAAGEHNQETLVWRME